MEKLKSTWIFPISMANVILKILTKLLKYGLRGGATIFIPLVTIPLIGNVFGLGAYLQCGLAIKGPLIVFWFQTLVAWTDDILRWIPAIDW